MNEPILSDEDENKYRLFNQGAMAMHNALINKLRLKDIKKQPPGVMPGRLVLEDRLEELEAAIHRYLEAGFSIPLKWINELYEIKKIL